MRELIEKGYIPLDKSWIIRLGVLDILHSRDDIIFFLQKQAELSDDLQALLRAAIAWKHGEPVDVGESGTLYRFLKFAAWKLGEKKEFIIRGTLQKRALTDNPDIVNYPLIQLLSLDHGTSQWASASVLMGCKENLARLPYKLRLTYEAVKHWNEKCAEGKLWEPRYDETIKRQAEAYLDMIHFGKATFVPQQSEDYCFARVFGFITQEDGARRWPSLAGHESNRIRAVEEAIKSAQAGNVVTSDDHRVIQAIAMWAKINERELEFSNKAAVSKSWPQFWRFITTKSF